MRIFGPSDIVFSKYEKISDKNIEKTKTKDKIEVEISKDHKIKEKSVEKLKELDKLEKKYKIERLKKQVQAGEYKVDPEELAKIIVDIVL